MPLALKHVLAFVTRLTALYLSLGEAVRNVAPAAGMAHGVGRSGN